MAEHDSRVTSIEGGRSTEAQDLETIRVLAELVGDLRSLELDEVFQNMAEGIRPHVDYDTFAVLLLDDLGQELRFHFAVGFPDEVVRNWRFGIGQGLVGIAAETQETICVDDVRRDSRYISAADIRSELAIPLIVKNRTIGVLDVGSRKRRFFTDGQKELLGLIAGHLANGIENARLYENVRDQARMLSLLHEVGRELTSILDRERLLGKVAELVKRLVDYQLFAVMLWNEQTQRLEHTFSLRYDERFVKKGGFALGQGVTGTVAAQRQPMRVPNVHINPHFTSCGHGLETHSELAVPLVFKDRLVGVLDLESVEYNAFSEQHEQMLATLGSYVAVALENARLYQKVSEDERRLELDLSTAREIQKGLLPDDLPRADGLEFGVAYVPARQLGGDFYDFLHYDEKRLAFAVGDVAGKGAAAALYGALAVGLLRGHVVEHPCQPAEMLGELNRHLREPGIDNRFAAMVFGIYDSEERSVVLANGGFPRPFLVRDGRVEEVDVAGIPLGLFEEMTYRERRLDLRIGDVLVLSSDGLHETTDQRCEPFGARRMQSRLLDLAERSAQQIADELIRSAEDHEGACDRDLDDRTVVVLKLI